MLSPVNFEYIDSFFRLNKIDIICPKGKYHPFDFTNKRYLQPTNFEERGDWELKCYKHQTNYFLAFYLMNGNKNLYFSSLQYAPQNFDWKGILFAGQQLFDFILENGDTYGNNTYRMGAIILSLLYL